MNMELGSHYWTESEYKHLAFQKGVCENCGGDVQEANAVWIMEPESKCKSVGLKKHDGERLPEIYYSEEKGCCVCEDCM
jgi:hypothetical protein